MEFGTIRFRIDPALHTLAARVCAEQGQDLHDVLRGVVTRIARDKTVATELSAPRARPSPGRVPFGEYDARLWAEMTPTLEAALAVELLAHYIADCTAQLQDPDNSLHQEVVDHLTSELHIARQLRQHLDVSDREAVAAVIQTYGPRLRRRASLP